MSAKFPAEMRRQLLPRNKNAPSLDKIVTERCHREAHVEF